MREIEASTLRPGMRLPHALYTRQGVKLLAGGTLLTSDMCRMLNQSSWGELYLAASAAELQEAMLVRIAEPLHAGEQARADLVTAGGVVAVEAGQTVEPHHEDAYELGAFQGAPDREDARWRAARLKIADQYVADLQHEWKRLPLRVRTLPVGTPSPASSYAAAAPWPDESMVAAVRGERVKRLRRVFARVLSGLPVAMAEVGSIVGELVHWQRAQPERFAQIALLEARGMDDLAEHGYSVAALCVSIAARLGWTDADARLGGLAGLLADVGMSLVPSELRLSSRPLDEIEINRVRRHPTLSVVLLDAIDQLPEEIRLAAYQHHERENGSGYPRGLKGHAIGDLSKVVAVADTFAAASNKRRYRVTKRPYDAMEEVIMLASTGVFDRRCVRALVETAGLFPVGSRVLLSNNAQALVVGAHARAVDRPIVRMMQTGGAGTKLGLTVHLADFARDELWIRQPLD